MSSAGNMIIMNENEKSFKLLFITICYHIHQMIKGSEKIIVYVKTPLILQFYLIILLGNNCLCINSLIELSCMRLHVKFQIEKIVIFKKKPGWLILLLKISYFVSKMVFCQPSR